MTSVYIFWQGHNKTHHIVQNMLFKQSDVMKSTFTWAMPYKWISLLPIKWNFKKPFWRVVFDRFKRLRVYFKHLVNRKTTKWNTFSPPPCFCHRGYLYINKMLLARHDPILLHDRVRSRDCRQWSKISNFLDT